MFILNKSNAPQTVYIIRFQNYLLTLCSSYSLESLPLPHNYTCPKNFIKVDVKKNENHNPYLVVSCLPQAKL